MSAPWSSWDGGPAPRFTPLANAVIEYLLERRYQLCAYWFSARMPNPVVTIDISLPHHLIPEYPGPSLGRADCDSILANVIVSEYGGRNQQIVDMSDPASFHIIDAYFVTIAGRFCPSGSASKSRA